MQTPLPCPVCESENSATVYSSDASFGEAKEALTRFRINLCRDCGFVFQASAYGESASYDSAANLAYERFDVNKVFPFPDRGPKNSEPLEFIDRHLAEFGAANVLEIGSNRGDLLYLLKESHPASNIVGLDPTRFEDLRVPTIHALFSPELFSNRFDLILMVHTLEHLKNPRDVVRGIHDLLREDGLLFVEVPDVERSLEDRVDDFMPEHVSYFTLDTLRQVLDGFEILDYNRSVFLRVVARRGGPKKVASSENSAATVGRLESAFRAFSESRERLSNEILAWNNKGNDVLFYGVSYYFVKLLGELADRIDVEKCAFYDDNFTEAVEPAFGLPRRVPDSLGEDTMVVLCANNARSQRMMLNRLLDCGFKGRAITPWSGNFVSVEEALENCRAPKASEHTDKSGRT